MPSSFHVNFCVRTVRYKSARTRSALAPTRADGGPKGNELTWWIISCQSMIHNITLRLIWARGVRSMSSTVNTSHCVLMEDAILIMLLPALVLHGIIADQLKHSNAVEGCIDSRGRVEHEILAGMRIDELLGTLVCSQTDWPAVWDLLPRLVWHRDHSPLYQGRVDGPWIRHVSDTQVCRPTIVFVLPTAETVNSSANLRGDENIYL